MNEIGVPFTIEGFGVASLIVLTILSIIRGWLVPRQIMDKLMQAKDDTIRSLTIALDEQVKSNAKMLEMGDATNKLLQTLHTGVGKETDGH